MNKHRSVCKKAEVDNMGMKKLLAVLFSALLLVGVAGCGGNNAQQGAVTQKVMNAKTKQDFEPVTEIKEGRKMSMLCSRL